MAPPLGQIACGFQGLSLPAQVPRLGLSYRQSTGWRAVDPDANRDRVTPIELWSMVHADDRGLEGMALPTSSSGIEELDLT